MTGSTIARPRRILLATDLTARCDRALDRATQLADHWDAELIATYIVDPARAPQPLPGQPPQRWHRIADPLERMRWRIQRDLVTTLDRIRFILEEGDPAKKLLEIADREACDLIVTGMARQESFERIILGSTITRLVRGSSAPLLMVQNRGARPYRRIAVATDFSDAAFQALLTAGAFFPESSVTLFHAYDIPFAGFITHSDFNRDLEMMEREVMAKVLDDDRLEPALRERTRVVIAHGPLEMVLDEFVERQQLDLTVIGSTGRGAVFEALIGSTAKRLVETLEGDLLIVRHR